MSRASNLILMEVRIAGTPVLQNMADVKRIYKGLNGKGCVLMEDLSEEQVTIDNNYERVKEALRDAGVEVIEVDDE